MLSCSAPEPGPRASAKPVTSPHAASAQPLATAPASDATTQASATTPAASVPVPVDPLGGKGPKPITVERSKQLLFAYAKSASPEACADDGAPDEAIPCLLRERYAKDAEALALVMAIYEATGTVVGVEKSHRMDGGWRGDIDIVPELPVGRHRRHLGWISEALADFESFFDGLSKARPKSIPAYAFQPLEVRFFRSVRRTTPSAYASGWSFAYNVSGSLHKNATAVRETLFHEIFHLNDRAHDRWSEKALSADFEMILSKCTTKQRTLSTPCLRPFAPSDTMVRGGTFYAFQPGNGVWEYAAELAIRYYREHRLVLAGKPLARAAFKCGPEPNARAYAAMVDEFFDGIDLVPACP
jgi:hypothetical protein